MAKTLAELAAKTKADQEALARMQESGEGFQGLKLPERMRDAAAAASQGLEAPEHIRNALERMAESQKAWEVMAATIDTKSALGDAVREIADLQLGLHSPAYVPPVPNFPPSPLAKIEAQIDQVAQSAPRVLKIMVALQKSAEDGVAEFRAATAESKVAAAQADKATRQTLWIAGIALVVTLVQTIAPFVTPDHTADAVRSEMAAARAEQAADTQRLIDALHPAP